MKKVLVFVIALFLLSAVGVSAKDLVWDDPNPVAVGVYEYQAEFVDSNGQMVANPIVPKGVWVSITIPAGTYTVVVKAHNIWDWSAPSAPLTFDKVTPEPVINLRIE
jgi:hypothetical protein